MARPPSSPPPSSMCLPKPFSSSVPKRDAAAHFRTLEPRTALTSSCSSSSFAFKLLAAAERKQDVCSFDEKSGQTEETERRESGISHAPSWKWLNTSEEGVNALHCKCSGERTEDHKLKLYSICVRRSLVVGLRQSNRSLVLHVSSGLSLVTVGQK